MERKSGGKMGIKKERNKKRQGKDGTGEDEGRELGKMKGGNWRRWREGIGEDEGRELGKMKGGNWGRGTLPVHLNISQINFLLFWYFLCKNRVFQDHNIFDQ